MDFTIKTLMNDFELGLPYLSVRLIYWYIPVTVLGLGHNLQDLMSWSRGSFILVSLHLLKTILYLLTFQCCIVVKREKMP